jgi:EAL domain-containing protein (putative c-di-GMP-specific phosphodiesterase class I)/GGDEF domain-containing protein
MVIPDPLQTDRRSALKTLIENRAISTVFQPIVDLRSGSNIAFEALSRLQSVTPFQNILEVFDVANREGLLWELEGLTRQSTLHAAADWPRDVLLFLNSTPSVITDRRFEEAILSELDQTPCFSPERIVIEVTERAQTECENTLKQRLLRLKELGFRIAIDDVGAGSSGLNRIMALRPHWLKLDQEMIDHIDADPYKQNLVDFFVKFSKQSGVDLIVEGIEREQELRTLIELGAKVGQGYFLRRPDARLQKVTTEVSNLIVRQTAIASSRQRQAMPFSIVDRFTQDAFCCERDERVASVANRLGENQRTPGALVMHETQMVGWVSRRTILANASDPLAADQPISRLAAPIPSSIDSATPLTEALSQLACREDVREAAPILVSRDGKVNGVLSLEDLFNATSRMATEAHACVNPITGLPIRSVCDRVFMEAVDSKIVIDAVFIDIIGFHTFNEIIGYDAGDLALRILSGILISTARSAGECEIIGHLGDDRFLILQYKAVPDLALQEIVIEFEQAVERFAVQTASHSAMSCLLQDRPPTLGLRIVHVEAASLQASLPSELTLLIHQSKSTSPQSRLGARSTHIHLPVPVSLKKSA